MRTVYHILHDGLSHEIEEANVDTSGLHELCTVLCVDWSDLIRVQLARKLRNDLVNQGVPRAVYNSWHRQMRTDSVK